MSEIIKPDVERWTRNRRIVFDSSQSSESNNQPVLSIAEHRQALRQKRTEGKVYIPDPNAIDIRKHPIADKEIRLGLRKDSRRRQLLKRRLKEDFYMPND